MKHRSLLTFLCASVIALGSLTVLAQEKAPEPAPAGEAAAPVHKKNLWNRIEDGGIIMIPIGICSMLTLFLIGDGAIRVTSLKKLQPEDQLIAVKNFFRNGDYVGAYNYCKANPSAFTNVCRAAVGMLGEGKAAVEEATVGELSKENARMQFYISYLSVIGVCTPMIGLLGTVAGMITAFDVLGHSGIGDPSKLSEAIGEVLVATASGLLIAIPAFGCFYWLRSRATHALHTIQDTMASLFRKMPYEQFVGALVGGEELFAAAPNWAQPAGDAYAQG